MRIIKPLFILLCLSLALISYQSKKADNYLTTEQLYELFQNPELQYHPFVCLWWNGDKVESSIGGIEINPMVFPSYCDSIGKESLQWLSLEWIDMLKVRQSDEKPCNYLFILTLKCWICMWYNNCYTIGFVKEGNNVIEIQFVTTMGNYMKTMADNLDAKVYVNRKGREQECQPIGMSVSVKMIIEGRRSRSSEFAKKLLNCLLQHNPKRSPLIDNGILDEDFPFVILFDDSFCQRQA